MKKLSLLLMAVAFLCPKVANAQDGKGSINFVPYVGMNYSDFSGNTKEYFNGTSGKVNFMAGARFEFQIAEKSAVIADLNYRRLGATADNRIVFLRDDPYSMKYNFLADTPNEYYAEKDRELIMEMGGCIFDYKKVTLDCISFGPHFKQNITGNLSAKVGMECTFLLSARWYVYVIDNYGKYKYTSEDGIISGPVDFNRDDYEWIYTEYDTCEDIGGYFSDHLNVAIPLGLTYDYKNFSVNATYHLPLTKCAEKDEYSLCNQAFDLTIGYRLPLRKR